MRTAWCHFGGPPMHFRSRDLINVVFGKIAITPSFFNLKAFVSKLKLSRTLYRVSPIVKSANICAETGKKVFKYGNHGGCKNIDILYLSNGAR